MSIYPFWTPSGIVHPHHYRRAKDEGFDLCRLCGDQIQMMSRKGTGACCEDHEEQIEERMDIDAVHLAERVSRRAAITSAATTRRCSGRS